MEKIKIPYFKGFMEISVPRKNLKAVLVSKIAEYKAESGPEELVRKALAETIGTGRLKDLARGKKKVVLVTSDHTRAMPSKLTLPILLDEIRQGNSDAEITILVGTGLHRATTREELVTMFGQAVVDKENVVVHDAFDDSAMENMGTLPSGSVFSVNRIVPEADLLVCEGFIEPHFFAGYSGGRKSILPGVSSRATVSANHSARAIAHPLSRTGKLEGNPINDDMVYAAKKVGVAFILNVALNAEKEVIAAFAGDLIDAHEAGCKFVDDLSGADRVIADIVITSNSGYPLDQNIYQSPKGISTAAACAAEGGVIIMIASCCDGMGGDEFEKLMLKGKPQEILDFVSAIPDEETISEQWCAQILADIMSKYTLILVSDLIDPELVRKVNIIPAATPEEALQKAFALKGQDASITVIPDGVSVVVR